MESGSTPVGRLHLLRARAQRVRVRARLSLRARALLPVGDEMSSYGR